MHVLVTGASGFVGRALLRVLKAKGHRITTLMRPGVESPRWCAVLRYTLGSPERLMLPRDIDAIVHLAQSRAYREFPADATDMFRVNVVGSQSLLEAAATARISTFCLVSTGTVYEPYCQPLVENAPLRPTSYLGASKLAAEVIARPFSALFPLCVARIFSPYGPGQTERLIPDLIRRVREGEPVTLPETGAGMRFSPTYVDDVCDVIAAALEGAWAGTVNVAAPESLTIADAANIIGVALGRSPVFERKPHGAPVVVPNLSRLADRYEMTRFRKFADGLVTTLAGEI